MNRKVLNGICFSFLFLVASTLATAGTVPVQSKAFGKTYAQWATAWLEWAFSIPSATSPFFDTTGEFAAVGQSGKVWFLNPSFGGTITRTVTVPNGTALFFPIINQFWINTPEYGDNPWSPQQETFVRSELKVVMDTVFGLELNVDGKAVPNIFGFRVGSAVGQCTMPPDPNINIFQVALVNNPYNCLADGYWVMLTPLSVGQHTIQLKGTLPSGFSIDSTYNITVQSGRQLRMSLHP